MNSPQATLIVAPGARRITREDLRAIPEPVQRGVNHRPIPHHELVSTLDAVLREQGLVVTDEQYAVCNNGSRLFGTMKVRPAIDGHALTGAMRDGQEFCLGVRSGNARDVAISLVAGLKVTCCSNMLLASDFRALRKRHTLGLRLDAELRDAIERYQAQQLQVVAETDRARELTLTDDDARLAIFGAFERRIVSTRLFPEVVSNYFSPQPDWTDCQGRHRFALHNAFTRALRPAPAPVQFRATTALAYLLRPGGN